MWYWMELISHVINQSEITNAAHPKTEGSNCYNNSYIYFSIHLLLREQSSEMC